MGWSHCIRSSPGGLGPPFGGLFVRFVPGEPSSTLRFDHHVCRSRARVLGDLGKYGLKADPPSSDKAGLWRGKHVEVGRLKLELNEFGIRKVKVGRVC